jgi:hypothetical protein
MSRLQRALALGWLRNGAALGGSLLSGAVLAGGLFVTTSARAHINLLEPVARVPGFPDSMLLRGPCGQRQNTRLEDRVTVLRPGQSIDMVWEVYVQHVSYFRISFDPDGDDSFSTRPSAPSDASTDDPTELTPGDGELILDYILDRGGDADRVEHQVTLPNVECDRCTLQLTQFTYGLPLDDAIYYQCADLVLDDGDGVVEDAADRAPGGMARTDASHEGAGCSLGAGPARARGGRAGSWGWLAPLAGALALGVRLAGRDERRLSPPAATRSTPAAARHSLRRRDCAAAGACARSAGRSESADR